MFLEFQILCDTVSDLAYGSFPKVLEFLNELALILYLVKYSSYVLIFSLSGKKYQEVKAYVLILNASEWKVIYHPNILATINITHSYKLNIWKDSNN